MTENFNYLCLERKTGKEKFRSDGRPTGETLLDFWQWSSSNLVTKAFLNELAQFIVSSALGVSGGTHGEWDSVDLESKNVFTVEIKSAAYFQYWDQVRPSKITYRINRTHEWNSETGVYDGVSGVLTDVYIFCLLANMDRETLDPLNLDQWKFYVLLALLLDARCPKQKTISLPGLLKLNPILASYDTLASVIEALRPATFKALRQPAE